MTLFGAIYALLLLAVVTFILVRGRSEERIIVITLLLGSISTYFIYHYFGRDFTRRPILMLINESVVLAVLLAVAFRSKRFWPLPVAAFQVAAWLALVTPYFGQNIVSRGLGVAQGIWAYPQLIILLVAAARRPKAGNSRENSLPS